MKPSIDSCPECGAAWPNGQTCQHYFHQMLFWESENPALGEVHHLMVLCYHLQHPRLYSAEGLRHARQLLTGFVEEGLSPAEARRRNRERVDSGKRGWRVTAREGDRGAYGRPMAWTITAQDVVAGGMDNYVTNVRAWASSLQQILNESMPRSN
jgi:hypothetical protein